MTQALYATNVSLGYLANRRIGPISALMLRAVVVLATWEERSRSRTRLAELPPHLLKDIGIDEMRAQREAQRPFWQG